MGIKIKVEASAEFFLDAMLSRFGAKFPSTREFSLYARSTIEDTYPRDDPDQALMAWLDREETLFKVMEKQLVRGRLSKGFDEIEDFISFSLSV